MSSKYGDDYTSSDDDDDVRNRVYPTAGNDGNQRVKTDYSDIDDILNKANKEIDRENERMRKKREEEKENYIPIKPETIRDLTNILKKRASGNLSWETDWKKFARKYNHTRDMIDFCGSLDKFVEQLKQTVDNGECAQNCIEEVKLLLNRFEKGDLKNKCTNAQDTIYSLPGVGRKEEEPLELKF